jgi:hypothetical protein
MKKLLLVLAIGAFVACNDSGSSEKPAGGDTTINQPAPEAATPAPADSTGTGADSTATGDSTLQK